MTESESGLPYVKGGSDHRHAIRVKELVLAAQSGCASSFAEIREMYWRRLFRTVLSITRNTEDAEDALQDTFLRAFLALKGFQWRSTLYTWLTKIAINSSLMLLRSKHRRLEIPLTVIAESDSGTPQSIDVDVKDRSPGPEEIYGRRQMRLLMSAAIRRLDPRLRAVLEIHLSLECSIREIGCNLNISEAAVKSRLHRARRRLTLARVAGNGRVDLPSRPKLKTSSREAM